MEEPHSSMPNETSYPWLRAGGAALVMATLRVVHMRMFSCLVSLMLSVMCARCESVIVCVLVYSKALAYRPSVPFRAFDRLH